jgi:hypothetical protein
MLSWLVDLSVSFNNSQQVNSLFHYWLILSCSFNSQLRVA